VEKAGIRGNFNMNKVPSAAKSISLPEITSLYPEPFAALVKGRDKRKLGDHFGLSNFGINQTTLAPGAISALAHHHSKQDEFIYVLEGVATLLHGEAEYQIRPGDCMGFKAGSGVASQLINRSSTPVVYLEVGDRTAGDAVEYPDDDLQAVQQANGTWQFTHKDGRPY
jgi:uncharacterized cupin superfamily protein